MCCLKIRPSSTYNVQTCNVVSLSRWGFRLSFSYSYMCDVQLLHLLKMRCSEEHSTLLSGRPTELHGVDVSEETDVPSRL